MEKILKHSFLNLKDRTLLTLDGVSNIEQFDKNFISLEIEGESVKVEGEGMKIESLSKDDGTITVSLRSVFLRYNIHRLSFRLQ